jgi:hypothetical protein
MIFISTNGSQNVKGIQVCIILDARIQNSILKDGIWLEGQL